MINFSKRNVNIIVFCVSCIIYILINLIIFRNKSNNKETITENNNYTNIFIKGIEINSDIQSTVDKQINNSEDKNIKNDKEKNRNK